MFINIPLSQELLTWWIGNASYNTDDFSLSAPLPISLCINGRDINFPKEGMKLKYSFPDSIAYVDGYIGVSAYEESAQARLFGFTHICNHVEFKLSEEERKAIALMCAAADTIACRAIGDDSRDFEDDYKELFNKRSERENNG